MNKELMTVAALAMLAAACDGRAPATGGAGLSGRVSAFDGSPLANVTVHADGVGGPWTATTDAAGTFSVPAPAGTELRLWTTADGQPSFMRDGVRAGDADVDLRLPQTLSVSGVLVDDAGTPLSGRLLTLTTARGDAAGPLGGTATSAGGGAYVATDGTFRVDGLLPGAYAVDVPGGVPDGAPHVYCATEVVPAGATDLRLVASLDARVTGIVRDASGAPVAAQIHVGGREVMLSAHQPRIGMFIPGTTADAEGRFELTGLPPRRVTITAAYPGSQSVTLEVEAPASGIEFRLPPAR